jgi:putative DNA primase/helicase
MADFARWVVAAESSLPWEGGSFMKAYLENRASIIELGLEADPVGSSIMTLMDKNEEWTGPATNLLADLNKVAPDHFRRLRAWPKQPNALSNKLRRSATFLREKNYEIEWGKSGQRFISIRRVNDVNLPEVEAVSASADADVTLVIEEVE